MKIATYYLAKKADYKVICYSAAWSLARTARCRYTLLDTPLKIAHREPHKPRLYSHFKFQTLWSHISSLQTQHQDATRCSKYGSNLTDCALDTASLTRTSTELDWLVTNYVCGDI